ncbi:murein biosynthesis integral membrane protein MurJ [Actinomycetaceae bacterium L2_0104]
MPFRPKRPRGRHFNDGSGWGPRYDKWEAARVLAPTLQDVATTSMDVDTQTIPAIGHSSATPRRRSEQPRAKRRVERTMPEVQDAPPRRGAHRAKDSGRHASPREGANAQRQEDVQEQSTAAAPKKSVAQSSFVMFLGTFFSRFLGLVRSPILLGAVVGMTSPAANAFDVANKLPNLIYMVVVGGLVNAVLVPAIVRATKTSDDDGAAFINKLLTLAVVFLGAATLIITLAAPLIVKLFAATMSPEWYSLTVAFAYWCLPQIFFYGMYTVLGQILNARENFGPYMWAPALNNVVAIAGMMAILWIYGRFDDATAGDPSVWTGERIAMLGGFSTLGIAAQALILVWPMRRLGIKFRFDFKWRNSGLGSAGRASWWVLLSMIGGMIPTMVLSNAAAGATARAERLGIPLSEVAGNFVYTTSYTIYSIPTSLIVVSIATAMFTRLSTHAADKNMDAMRRDTSKTLRMVSTLMALCSVLMIALAVPISRVLATTVRPEEVVTLSRVLIAMSIGLVGIGAVNVLDRAYYAFEDTRRAFLLNLPFQMAGLVGFALCGFLPPRWTVIGIGLVMSLTNTGAAFLLAHFLRARMGGIDGRRILKVHLKLLAISLVTVLIGMLISTPLTSALNLDSNVLRSLVSILVLAPVLSLIYFGLMKLLRMEEVASLEAPVRGILRKVGVKK